MKVENINRETATVVLTKGELYSLARILTGEAINEKARGIYLDYAKMQFKRAGAFYDITDSIEALNSKPCAIEESDY